MALKIEEIEKQMRGNVDSCCHPEYWNIRNYAPTIASQYIKARRFEVTEEFLSKVADNCEIGGMTYLDYAKKIMETMWEEIENA